MSRRQPRIAVIGAGVAGIAALVKLKKAGFSDVMAFERWDSPGGTWLVNDYPGCAVDIPSHLYSFSFMPWDWTRTHATQAEILAYLQSTVAAFGIAPSIQYGTDVRSIVWSNETQRYTLTFASGDPEDFDAVISCVGLLNQPKHPHWPGLADFAGPAFHTARWEHGHDLNGKTVAVVGTGASAAQVVPAIAPVVGQLLLFQREAGWVLPKGDREFTEAERKAFVASPLTRRRERLRIYREMAQVVNAWREGSPLNNQLRDTCLAFISDTVESSELRVALTPDFPYACKRVVRSDDLYHALNRTNVTLIPHAVTGLTDSAVVANGQAYDVDIVVMATGFSAQDFLSTIEVVGVDGRRLRDEWGDLPRALIGSTVPGFPNFFIAYGPNTNGGGSIIFQIEQSVNFAVRALRRARRRSRIVDVRPAAYGRYEAWIDRTIEDRLHAQTQCNNYYRTGAGKNVTQWPLTHGAFRRANWFWQYRGLRLMRRTSAAKPTPASR